jgi:vesicle coat complex subunit
MDTKEHLIKTIKEWVRLDNDIKKLQKEQTERKVEKKKISENLISIMKKNEIDCFDIKNGKICYDIKNVKKPITKKALMTILSKYYEGDILKATEVNDFILENREETTKENIIIKVGKGGN